MNQSRNRRRSATLAFACAAILSAAATAQAQNATGEGESPATTLEEVVVTGFRHSLESSIAVKREADVIIESVSAEEIGKLPDVSIAESLARLPGLAAQRVDGRAQVLSLRGMAPKYAVTLLNGREIVSTGDNRSVEYDQFPSELINRATVYKTQDASLIAQGLSGTVNLESVRPLDYTTPQVSLGLRGELNSHGELNDDSRDLGGRVSASYVGQFADNTLGLAIGFAHLDNPGQEEYYKSWWWANTANWGAPLPGVDPTAIALQGFESGVTSTKRVRDGLMAVLEYKPNEVFHSLVDVYYSQFDQESIQREFQSSITVWDGVSYTSPTYTEFGGDTIVTGGTITNARPVVLNRHNDREDDILALGWRNELVSGNWTLAADLSYSKASRDEINSELTAGTQTRTSFTSIDIDVDGEGVSHFTPLLDYADPAVILLTDPAGWGRDGRSSLPRVEDKLKSIALSASRSFDGALSSFEAGVSYSDRTKDMNRTEVYYYLKDGRTPVQLAAGDLVAPSSLGHVGIPGVLSFDFNRVLGTYYDSGVPAALDQTPGRTWNVGEKITRGYGKVGFRWNTRWPVRGNLGVQVVRQQQESQGYIWNGALVPISDDRTYTDVLPGLNLIVDVTDNLVVRFGAAKEMARPNIEDMRAGFSNVSVSATPPYMWSANGGNPWLEPWRADAADLSFEYYLGRGSYLALAGFYKDLESFVYNQTIDYDFTGFPNPGPNQPASNIGNLSAPANGTGGFVKGLELSFALEAGRWSDALDGFGLVGSVSWTASSLHEENNPSKPLDGMSGRVDGLTLYYEKHGISARISQRYRTEFLTTVRNQFNDNQSSAINEERIVDFQAGYSFSGGRLDGLSILFQVNNMTDEPYRTGVGVATGSVNPNQVLPERYNTYGRQYLLGVTYKL